MCRTLVDARPVLGENNSPVRLFAGSGMRVDVWKRLVERFGPVGVCELYASTEAHTVLANASGKAIGSVGRPLPGSPDVHVAAWSFEQKDFVRDTRGHLVRARLDEPGVLVARLRSGVQGEIAHIDPRRLIRDAFEPGDIWFNTGDVFEVDTLGDFYFIDRAVNMISTPRGPIASTRIEDAIHTAPGVALCVALGDKVAIELRPNARLDLAGLSTALATLPEYARPHRVKLVAEIPMTDGFRPMKRVVTTLDFGDGDTVFAWDTLTQRLVPTVSAAAVG
jgi:putative long chain acyl-CoA synthase